MMISGKQNLYVETSSRLSLDGSIGRQNVEIHKGLRPHSDKPLLLILTRKDGCECSAYVE